MLHGKLVKGIEDARIQQRKLAEDGLAFKKALDLTQALEVAAQDSKELSASSSSVVHNRGVARILTKGGQDIKIARENF